MSQINSSSGAVPLGGRLLFRQECVFWSTAAVLLFLFLWSSFLWENEALYSEITREMAVSGNWFHPAVNWQILPGSPILNHWAALPFVKLFGFSEFAVRLPGVLAAFGALWAMRILGKRIFDDRTSGIGCWLFLGCAGFLFWGRSATSDMINVMVMLWSIVCFWHLEEKQGYSAYLLFYLLCFSAPLFNGLNALILLLLVLLPLFFRDGGKKHLNRNNFAALFTGIVFVSGMFYLPQLLPPAPGQVSSADLTPHIHEVIWQEISLRLRQLSLLPGTWYRFWEKMIFFLLPWTFLLPVGIGGMLKNWKSLPGKFKGLFISVSGALFFCSVFFCQSFETVLPLLPLILLFAAAGFGGKGVPKWNSKAFAAAYYICIAAASLCICSIVTYPLWEKIAAYTPPAVLVLGPVAAGFISWMALFMDHRPNSSFTHLLGLPHRVGAVLFAGTILSGCAFSGVLPVVCREFNTEKSFFLALHKGGTEKYADRENTLFVSFAAPVPPAYLFYNALSSPVESADDLGLLLQKYPGKRVVLFMKNRTALLDNFKEQCRKYGILCGKPFLSEEVLRWSSPDSRRDSFVAFLITLPKERNDKNG